MPVNPLQLFTAPNPVGMSFTEMERRRALANSLGNAVPINDIRSNEQGFAHVLGKVGEAYGNYRADAAEREKTAALAKALGPMLGEAGLPAEVTGAMGGQEMAHLAMQMAMQKAQMQRQAQQGEANRQAEYDMWQRKQEYERANPPAPSPTTNMQELAQVNNERAKQGMSPISTEQWVMQKTRASAPKNMGNIPPGFKAVYDENGQPIQLAPIPGGPADAEAGAAANKQAMRKGLADTSGDVVKLAAQRAREAAQNQNFGPSFTNVVGQLPWTDSAEVLRQVNVLKAMAAAENLNAMRQASPTGGALGNASDQDIKLLKDKAGALDPTSPNFIRDLNDYEKTLLRIIHGGEPPQEYSEDDIQHTMQKHGLTREQVLEQLNAR